MTQTVLYVSDNKNNPRFASIFLFGYRASERLLYPDFKRTFSELGGYALFSRHTSLAQEELA